eukprot:8582132-Alexandrium_andersonii.AAC.1
MARITETVHARKQYKEIRRAYAPGPPELSTRPFCGIVHAGGRGGPKCGNLLSVIRQGGSPSFPQGARKCRKAPKTTLCGFRQR